MLFPRESLLQEAHAFLLPSRGKPGGRRGSPFSGPCRAPLFDPPLLGISAAHDPLYATLKAPEAIGPWFLSPEEGCPGRPRCCPFSSLFPGGHPEQPPDTGCPSPAWLHGRVEGRPFFRWARHLVALLQAAYGWQALCPCLDPLVCLHGTPGHRPPVSSPGRLYQPVVRAPRRLYQRPGDLRPAQGPHHRTGNLQGGLSAS